MKTVRLIKITASSRKIVTMQESIWNTILKDPSMLPAGVTYELAPTDKLEPIELLAEVREEAKEVSEDVEPIQVFTPEMVEEKPKAVKQNKKRK
jgi:hypothetical protein